MNRGHCQVLNGGADVFRCIAAEWKSIDPESVNDNLRQQAKQVQLGRRERRSHGPACILTPVVFADLLWHYLWDGS